ncbi:MAG: 2,3-diphosphoglycerate-dependent phosphoglycerate mutase [Candidatus Margulisbacteria bacterium]|nr:2,3-diphosphoglycerate-dependent phosphoglycerate mutase [Candidatus Margulisiibacteriota bacterium]
MKLVLVRHGESIWNLENRFTGWTDVALSDRGVQEAKEAGKKLLENGYSFDLAYTSVLKRAKDTLSIILKELNLQDIEIINSYKLNERHYGALQGLNKKETAEKYGDEQVQKWRRSMLELPPLVALDDSRYPGKDDLYTGIPITSLPFGENLEMTINRVVPFYKNVICPQFAKGRKIIISAHGNSLRALVMVLDEMTDDEVMNLNIPTGAPMVYELDACLKPRDKYYL